MNQWCKETHLNIHFIDENSEGREMIASAVNEQWFPGVRGPIVVNLSVATYAGPFARPIPEQFNKYSQVTWCVKKNMLDIKAFR